MKYIFITLKLKDGKTHDLRIPIYITANEFLKMIEKSFDVIIDKGTSLHVEPLGRILGGEELLADEKIYNGALITLV